MISMNDFKNKLSNLSKDELILDVRTPEEHKEARIKGSRNIPVDVVDQHADELRGFKKVYIHCRSGGRAQRALAALQAKGLTNLECAGQWGMKDWLEAGHPAEKG